MTISEYFHYRRLLEHYEEEASRTRFVAVVSLISAIVFFIMGAIMAAITKEFIVLGLFLIPTIACGCLGISAEADAEECDSMIIHIKNKMW